MWAAATPTPSPTSPRNCIGFNVVECAQQGIVGIVNSATGVIDFWSDPWGNTFKALQDSARNLSTTVLPAVTKATLPDLNASWFLRAYAVSFALAIFIGVALLLPQAVRVARGAQSGRELLESVGVHLPVFLIGSIFGPPFGVILVNFFGALSDSIIGWGVSNTAGTVSDRFRSMLSAQDATGIAGGAPVGVLLLLLMLLGLLLVIVMLVVQLVTLYFTGVLLPLGLVWTVDPARRRFGMRIVAIWIGILAAHPLLFLLLSVAYLMVGSNIDAFGSGASLQKTVTLVVSLLSLFIAGLSPLALLRLAPVMAGGVATGGAASLPLPTFGPRNLSDADSRYNPAGLQGGGSAPSAGAASAGQEPEVAGGESVSEAAAPASAPSAAPAMVLNGVPLNAEGAEIAPAAADAAGGAAVGGTAAGAAMAGGAAAGAGAATGAAVAEGGAVAAAGAAESATGVGAAVGVPMILAGVAFAGAKSVKRGTNGIADRAAAPVEAKQERLGRERPDD